MSERYFGPTFEWSGRRFLFDRRPVPILLLSRSLRLVAILLLIGVFLGGAFEIPAPVGLEPAAWRTLWIFGLAVVLWLFQPIPLSITGLLIFALIPLTQILDARTAYAAFGNRVVFFILGAFILAGVLMSSGLSTRLTLLTLTKVGNRPRRLIATIYLLGAVFSCLMSEHAVAAMLFPLVLEIAMALGLKPGESRYGKALFLSLSWGCIVGGSLTILGGGRGPLAIGILEEFTQKAETIHFLEFSLINLPTVAVMMIVGWILLNAIFSKDLPDLAPAEKILRERLIHLGRLTFREGAIGVVMILTILSWIFTGEDFGLANIAILSTVVLFVLNLTTWREIEHSVNWGIILMYGGAICLGAALDQTGAARWVAQRTLGSLGNPYLLMTVFAAASLILTAFMSNSAVIAVLTPIALSMSSQLGIDLKAATMVIVLTSNLDFTLPMGTPATAIAYSSGYIRMKDNLFWGLIMVGCGFGAVILMQFFYWPFLGLAIGR